MVETGIEAVVEVGGEVEGEEAVVVIGWEVEVVEDSEEAELEVVEAVYRESSLSDSGLTRTQWRCPSRQARAPRGPPGPWRGS